MNIFEGLGYDWYLSFYPAIQAFLSGSDPYQISSEVVANPPWLILLLSPLGFLPSSWGFLLIGLINLSGLMALFIKHQRAKLSWPVAVSFPFIAMLVFGNIDGLSLWGLALGGPLGLILLSTKPQVASLVGLIWLKQAWQRERWQGVVRLVAPLAVLAAVMISLYPNYIRNTLFFSTRTDGVFVNGFPWFIPAGIAALVAAFRHEREDLATVATVLVSPYARIQSWVAALGLLVIQYPLYGTIMALSSWLVLVIMVVK